MGAGGGQEILPPSPLPWPSPPKSRCLTISKSFVFVYGENDDSLVKSFRNLSNSKLTSVTKLSTYDVISNEALVFSENAINTFLEQR